MLRDYDHGRRSNIECTVPHLGISTLPSDTETMHNVSSDTESTDQSAGMGWQEQAG